MASSPARTGDRGTRSVTAGSPFTRGCSRSGTSAGSSGSDAPVLLGSGVRLLDGVEKGRFSIEIDSATHSPKVTHVRYAVRRK